MTEVLCVPSGLSRPIVSADLLSYSCFVHLQSWFCASYSSLQYCESNWWWLGYKHLHHGFPMYKLSFSFASVSCGVPNSPRYPPQRNRSFSFRYETGLFTPNNNYPIKDHHLRYHLHLHVSSGHLYQVWYNLDKREFRNISHEPHPDQTQNHMTSHTRHSLCSNAS